MDADFQTNLLNLLSGILCGVGILSGFSLAKSFNFWKW